MAVVRFDTGVTAPPPVEQTTPPPLVAQAPVVGPQNVGLPPSVIAYGTPPPPPPPPVATVIGPQNVGLPLTVIAYGPPIPGGFPATTIVGQEVIGPQNVGIPPSVISYGSTTPGDVAGVDATSGAGTDQTGSGLPEDQLPDLGDRSLEGITTLTGMAFVQYVRNACDKRNLDDLAVFANSMAEGIGGGIGDDGTSFGPWQMHQGGALPSKYNSRPAYDPAVNAWAWSASGIDYALDSMVKAGAAGLRGHAAVHAIVFGFERPANIGGQELAREEYYDALAGMSDPYSYLAGRANGPSGEGSTAPSTVTAVKKSPVGANARWRDIIDAFGKDLPKLQDKIEAKGDNLLGVF